jgi:hypothetical protein
MTTSTAATTTWPQALAWRIERQLLDPTRPVSASDVVRRLGAVLSMDESLADLAVSTEARPRDLVTSRRRWRTAR